MGDPEWMVEAADRYLDALWVLVPVVDALPWGEGGGPVVPDTVSDVMRWTVGDAWLFHRSGLCRLEADPLGRWGSVGEFRDDLRAVGESVLGWRALGVLR